MRTLKGGGKGEILRNILEIVAMFLPRNAITLYYNIYEERICGDLVKKHSFRGQISSQCDPKNRQNHQRICRSLRMRDQKA